MVSGGWVFFWRLVGGVLAEFLSISKHRGEAVRDWPAKVRLPSYWVFGVLWVLVGGLLAVLLSSMEGVRFNELVAVNIGASAPLLVERLIAKAPPIDLGKVD